MQGYLLRSQRNKLKAEYHGLPGQEIAAAKNRGEVNQTLGTFPSSPVLPLAALYFCRFLPSVCLLMLLHPALQGLPLTLAFPAIGLCKPPVKMCPSALSCPCSSARLMCLVA